MLLRAAALAGYTAAIIAGDELGGPCQDLPLAQPVANDPLLKSAVPLDC